MCKTNFYVGYLYLGIMYEKGLGVEQNTHKANEMYSKAVELGGSGVERMIKKLLPAF